MATRGPSGGGQRPRVRSSDMYFENKLGGDILEPEAERLEDVALTDLVGAVEVGRGAGDPPRPMEAAGRESTLLGPALERAARCRLQPRELPQPRRFELGVEASLALQLAAARRHHPITYGCRTLA